jgi:hypothetical protein
MTFRNFLERTLYHGTIVDNEPSIKKLGLFGQVGDFQTTAGYDDETYGEPPSEEDEVVFMTDKQRLGRSVTAMVHHIAKKLRKGFHDVTDDDIRNHGLLCIIHSDRESTVRPEYEDERGERYPRGAEPGDYYSYGEQPDQFVRGAALLRLLKRYGEWPRDYGEEGHSSREKQLRGMLVASILRQHPEYPRDDVVQQIQDTPMKELSKYFRKYLPQWQQVR